MVNVLLLTAEEASPAEFMAAETIRRQMDVLTMRGYQMELAELEVHADRREFHACVVLSGLSSKPNEEQIMILVNGVREWCGTELPFIILCLCAPEDALIATLLQKHVVLVSCYETVNIPTEVVRHAQLATQDLSSTK